MDIVLHVVHVLAALALIALILVQQGKGADAGASFGSGASQTVFGSAGSGNFLTRATAVLAVAFMLSSLALAWMARQQAMTIDPMLNVLETIQLEDQASVASDVPAAPVAEDLSVESDIPAADVGGQPQ